MGFSFEVIPSAPVEPLLPRLAAGASERLRAFVADLPVDRFVHLSEPLRREARARFAARAGELEVRFPDAGKELPLDRPWSFEAAPGELAGEVRAVRFTPGDAFERAFAGERLGSLASRGLAQRYERCRGLGVVFEVTRSVGQPILVALAQGFVAATLAELTDGVLLNSDGAWDPALFPCLAEPFLASYMRPHAAPLPERYRRTAEERLRELPSELELFDEPFIQRVLDEMVGQLVVELNPVRGEENAERAAFARAIERIETVRILGPLAAEAERQLLVGDGPLASPGHKPSALTRLHPTAAEYERWIGHLGELLP